jgi:protein SCO1/2
MRKLLIVFGLSFLVNVNLAAQVHSKHPAPVTKPAAVDQQEKPGSSGAQNYFSDVELINQDGVPMRLYSDLLKGHTVAIIPFFTTCTSVCPPMNATMSKIQSELGDRVGKDVYLISISVDPLTDTPERLRAYGAKFKAKPGWYLLGGKKENVDWALYKLGMFVENKNDHNTIMVIGNEATGLWKKAFALAKPSELVTIIQSVADDKVENAAHP